MLYCRLRKLFVRAISIIFGVGRCIPKYDTPHQSLNLSLSGPTAPISRLYDIDHFLSEMAYDVSARPYCSHVAMNIVAATCPLLCISTSTWHVNASFECEHCGAPARPFMFHCAKAILNNVLSRRLHWTESLFHASWGSHICIKCISAVLSSSAASTSLHSAHVCSLHKHKCHTSIAHIVHLPFQRCGKCDSWYNAKSFREVLICFKI
jgi:hypothetical protein